MYLTKAKNAGPFDYTLLLINPFFAPRNDAIDKLRWALQAKYVSAACGIQVCCVWWYYCLCVV